MTIRLLDKNENTILVRPFKLGYVNIILLERVEAELLTSWEIHDELGNCLLSHWQTFKYDYGPCNRVVSLTPKETQEVQAALREGKPNSQVKIHPKQEKIIIGTKTENVSWYETKPLL